MSASSRQTAVKKRLSMVRKFPASAAFLPLGRVLAREEQAGGREQDADAYHHKVGLAQKATDVLV
ncbi:MAG: hypothetical protein LC795_19425 [Acidobacteria bacterium]|nr:hypothetical protein [Acidobacteriota bacterium]